MPSAVKRVATQHQELIPMRRGNALHAFMADHLPIERASKEHGEIPISKYIPFCLDPLVYHFLLGSSGASVRFGSSGMPLPTFRSRQVSTGP